MKRQVKKKIMRRHSPKTFLEMKLKKLRILNLQFKTAYTWKHNSRQFSMYIHTHDKDIANKNFAKPEVL